MSSVELMIIRNNLGSSRAADNQWNFGQIHALLVLYGPLISLLRTIKIVFDRHRAKKKKEDGTETKKEDEENDESDVDISDVF